MGEDRSSYDDGQIDRKGELNSVSKWTMAVAELSTIRRADELTWVPCRYTSVLPTKTRKAGPLRPPWLTTKPEPGLKLMPVGEDVAAPAAGGTIASIGRT
jgi:hypothetical protein